MSNEWIGPFKTADEALENLRRACAEIIGANPDQWPEHKNAPLAIASALGLREGVLKANEDLCERAYGEHWPAIKAHMKEIAELRARLRELEATP